MAGVIVFHNGDWYSSGGAFRSMAAGVIQHLPDTEAAISVKESLESAVNSWLYFVDVAAAFSLEMVYEFQHALDHHIKFARSQRIEDLECPELHPGYLERLAALQKKLNETLSTPK